MSRAPIALLLAALSLSGASGEERILEFAPAPVGNPLKGLVPYAGAGNHRFPHSMEFSFIPALRAAGAEALRKWETQLIGGEIRPEAWGRVFDEAPGDPRIQDFEACVRETHATWLMDSGMFGGEPAGDSRRARAEAGVRAMGYTFHVPSVRWSREGSRLKAAARIENRGVAPFYASWPLEWALLDGAGQAIRSVVTDSALTGILPGDGEAIRSVAIDLAELPRGDRILALRVANPLAKGAPVRFANATQDQHAPGWLTLGEIPVP